MRRSQDQLGVEREIYQNIRRIAEEDLQRLHELINSFSDEFLRRWRHYFRTRPGLIDDLPYDDDFREFLIEVSTSNLDTLGPLIDLYFDRQVPNWEASAYTEDFKLLIKVAETIGHNNQDLNFIRAKYNRIENPEGVISELIKLGVAEDKAKRLTRLYKSFIVNGVYDNKSDKEIARMIPKV